MSSSELKKYRGKCHCGKLAYEFDHPPLEDSTPTKCNCSICTDRGYLVIYPKQITFTNGSLEEATRYSFGKKRVGHFFCPVCGSSLGGKMLCSTGGYAMNLRLIEGVDLEALTYKIDDGANEPSE